MRLFALFLLGALMTGCVTTRTLTISSRPAGAAIDVDGVRQARNPLSYQFTWETETDIHYVTANLPGYKEQTIPLKRDFEHNELLIDLKPLTKKLTFQVQPTAAIISINGRPITSEPVSAFTTGDLEFTKDQRTGAWTTYTITAKRQGFKDAEVSASWPDKDPNYTLALKPMEKELNVVSNPPGATITLDDEVLGTSPIEKVNFPFTYDTTTESFYKHKLRASLPGYPDKTLEISWDEGQKEYKVDLLPSSKSIKIRTVPPGGLVTLDGKALKQDAAGDSLIEKLVFPPIDAKGDLKTYPVVITKKTADAEWYPTNFTLAWDDGKSDYTIPLREIRTMKLPLLTLAVTRGNASWDIAPKQEETIAGKDIGEKTGRAVQRLTPSEIKGQSIDSLSISPDGKRLLFSVLVDKPDFHSLIYTLRTDGASSPELINDGKSLDVTPAFSPDGDQIVFSSDRAGNRLSVWSVSASGAMGAQQYTTGDTTDLWPVVDSSPKSRLFCQSFTDRLSKPRIFSRPIDMISRTDLGVDGGMQPRINAKNDAVLFSAYNEKTRKRDIFRVGDRGGMAVNLTNTPDVDEYDAIWDRDGSRIAFVSDKGQDDDKRNNADIWVLDLTQSGAGAIQITSNPSQDDHPVWDPNGKAIYFRSNRGGEWGIWKISLK